MAYDDMQSDRRGLVGAEDREELHLFGPLPNSTLRGESCYRPGSPLPPSPAFRSSFTPTFCADPCVGSAYCSGTPAWCASGPDCMCDCGGVHPSGSRATPCSAACSVAPRPCVHFADTPYMSALEDIYDEGMWAMTGESCCGAAHGFHMPDDCCAHDLARWGCRSDDCCYGDIARSGYCEDGFCNPSIAHQTYCGDGCCEHDVARRQCHEECVYDGEHCYCPGNLDGPYATEDSCRFCGECQRCVCIGKCEFRAMGPGGLNPGSVSRPVQRTRDKRLHVCSDCGGSGVHVCNVCGGSGVCRE